MARWCEVLLALIATLVYATAPHANHPDGRQAAAVQPRGPSAATRSTLPMRTTPTARARSGSAVPGNQAPSAWRIRRRDRAGIAGCADRTSVLPGQPVRLDVSRRQLGIECWRIAWARPAAVRDSWSGSLRCHLAAAARAEALDSEEVDRALQTKPDVALMDIHMPVLDASKPPKRPGAQLDATRMVRPPTFDLDEYEVAAYDVGASGLRLKAAPPAELIATAHTVHAGNALLAASTRRLIEQLVQRSGGTCASASPGGTGPCRVAESSFVREHDCLDSVAEVQSCEHANYACIDGRRLSD